MVVVVLVVVGLLVVGVVVEGVGGGVGFMVEVVVVVVVVVVVEDVVVGTVVEGIGGVGCSPSTSPLLKISSGLGNSVKQDKR